MVRVSSVTSTSGLSHWPPPGVRDRGIQSGNILRWCDTQQNYWNKCLQPSIMYRVHKKVASEFQTKNAVSWLSSSLAVLTLTSVNCWLFSKPSLFQGYCRLWMSLSHRLCQGHYKYTGADRIIVSDTANSWKGINQRCVFGVLSCVWFCDRNIIHNAFQWQFQMEAIISLNMVSVSAVKGDSRVTCEGLGIGKAARHWEKAKVPVSRYSLGPLGLSPKNGA